METKINKSSKISVLHLILLAGIYLCSLKMYSQTYMDDIAAVQIGEYVGPNFQQAAKAIGEMRSSSASASLEIDDARKKYWQAVKTGQGLEQAANEFRRQLWLKDFYYLMMAIPEGTSGPRAIVLNILSGGIDGGIRPEAQPYFQNWVRAIRIDLGAENSWSRQESNNFIIPNLSDLAEALEANKDQMEKYIRVRDWSEIDASGLKFSWDQDAKSHIFMILSRYTPENPTKKIKENYQALVDLFGESEVLAAGEKIRQAPRNSKGLIAHPASLGIYSNDPAAAFTELLATKDISVSFKYLFWQAGQTPEEGVETYNFYTYIYNKDQIDEAFNKVMYAPRDRYGEGLSNKARTDLGISSFDLIDAIPEYLAKQDPLGDVKFFIAKATKCKSKEQFEQIFNPLLEQYGQQNLIDSHKAYYVYQKYQNKWLNFRKPIQIEKANALEQELKGKNLDEEQQQYYLLLKTLENGITNTYAVDVAEYDILKN